MHNKTRKNCIKLIKTIEKCKKVVYYEAINKKEQEEYGKNATVGKAGLEKVMDTTLRGENGDMKIYVNNVGKVIETVQGKQPSAGNLWRTELPPEEGFNDPGGETLWKESQGIYLTAGRLYAPVRQGPQHSLGWKNL